MITQPYTHPLAWVYICCTECVVCMYVRCTVAGGGWAAVWGAVGGRSGLHLWLYLLFSLLETLSVQLEENRICELERRQDII